VNRNYRPTSRGWAIVLLGAALALGGCGRKGGLDLPPNASPQAAAAAQADADHEPGVREQSVSQQGVLNPNSDVPPTAPKGRRKKFVLDPLLD
jgi:predicted small lipoprotein YifL